MTSRREDRDGTSTVLFLGRKGTLEEGEERRGYLLIYWSKRYADKTHYLEPTSFSDLILIRQLEYFLDSIICDDCSMIEFVPRQSIRDDPQAYFKAELENILLPGR
jgi:hypothetical protein